MAGPACKEIINNLTRAISESIAHSLSDPLVRGPILAAEKCDDYLQRLVDLDVKVCVGAIEREDGDRPVVRHDSLRRILVNLKDDGMYTDEIWTILQQP